jgi:hypothetical protein
MGQWVGSLKVSAESAHGAHTFMCRLENKDKMDVACSSMMNASRVLRAKHEGMG